MFSYLCFNGLVQISCQVADYQHFPNGNLPISQISVAITPL